MSNKYNDFWENAVLEKIPDNIVMVKKDLEPLINAKIKSESAISNSVDALQTPLDSNFNYVNSGFVNENAFFNGAGMGNDNSQTKAKQRVLTRPLAPGVIPSSGSSEPSSYNQVNYGPYQDINNDNGFSMNGSAQALILICTAILVVLVVFVSLLVMKYIGF